MTQKYISSFTYAFKGIWIGLQERNARVHVLVAILTLGLGWYFQIMNTEWIVIFFCISMVFSAELFNTALEKICDAVAPLHNDMYRKMGEPKDLAAGAVLVSAAISLIVGIIIFLPHLLLLFQLQ